MGGCSSKESTAVLETNSKHGGPAPQNQIKKQTPTTATTECSNQQAITPTTPPHPSTSTPDTDGNSALSLDNSTHSNRSSRSDRSRNRMDGSGHSRNRSRLDASVHGMTRSISAVGLDSMIAERKEDGDLASNVVHIEVPFGKPIEEVYDGVHDGTLLGSGISGLVRLCTHKKTGVKYAVKCLDLGLIETDRALEQLREEIFTMCQLDHPNIVRLEEVYESLNEIYLVLELCLGGELFDRLDEQPDYHYTEQQCARLVKQMLCSVRYIHSKGFIHRDLKLENFLFSSTDPDSELKLIDFGLSKHFEFGEVQNEAVGTPYTVAPEVIRGGYDERCDVWAIGVITYLLLSGDPPFGGCGGPETLAQVRSNILRGDFEFEPVEIWADVSEQAKDFIRKLLVIDPRKRPNAREAQMSPWLHEWAVKDTKPGSTSLNPNVVKALVSFKEYGDMRKLLCEVLSFTLLPDQIQDLRKEFEKLDKDGSGEISLQALKKVLMENAGAGSLGALTEEEVEDIFNAMRVRKTEATIHWHEFIAAGLSQCKVDDRNLRLAFDRLDADHKGYITIEDIVDLMGSDGTASEERIRRMYIEGLRDVKKSGNVSEISYEDFLLLMKGQPKETPQTAMGPPRTPVLQSTKKSLVLSEIPELDLGESHEDISIEPKMESEQPEITPNDTINTGDNADNKSIPNKSVFRRQRSQSEGVVNLLNDPEPLPEPIPRRSGGPNVAVNLPEHDHHDKNFDKLIHDESKTAIVVNRNLYRAHRQMRLAVIEASKLFEEEQMKRVFQEQVKINSSKRVGAGLVMKHGTTKKLSTEEVRKILRQREAEQQCLVEKANKQAGRGRRRRKKTVSDMSGMLGNTPPSGANEGGNNSVGSGGVSKRLYPGSNPPSPAIKQSFDLVEVSPTSLPPLPKISMEESGDGVDLEEKSSEDERMITPSPTWPPPPPL